MNAILSFKALEDDDVENCPCGTDLRDRLNSFHRGLMGQVSLNALQQAAEETDSASEGKPGEYFLSLSSFAPFTRGYNTVIRHVFLCYIRG